MLTAAVGEVRDVVDELDAVALVVALLDGPEEVGPVCAPAPSLQPASASAAAMPTPRTVALAYPAKTLPISTLRALPFTALWSRVYGSVAFGPFGLSTAASSPTRSHLGQRAGAAPGHA